MNVVYEAAKPVHFTVNGEEKDDLDNSKRSALLKDLNLELANTIKLTPVDKEITKDMKLTLQPAF
jgi:uncharacterized protein YabE (DUF348 family)